MKLTLFDILIILAYLASTIVIGLVMKKRAQKDKSAYMLGGNKLPKAKMFRTAEERLWP